MAQMQPGGEGEGGGVPRAERPRGEVIYRHAAAVRLTHWINALAIFLMVGSGLNIFNAHPALYWGAKGSNADPSVPPWLAIHAASTPGGPRGLLDLGGWRLETTGVLGWSRVGDHFAARGFPAWLTIPSFQDLADARRWHFLLAWVLVVNGLLYLAWSLGSRHLQRDLAPTWADLKAIPRSVWDHVRLRHPTGEAAKRYNVLQRLAYLGLILSVTTMVVTGLAMSPGIDAFAPGLLELLGGRQSARSIHFVGMGLIVLFIVVHLVEVVLAGPLNEVGSMLTGRFRLPPPEHAGPLGEDVT